MVLPPAYIECFELIGNTSRALLEIRAILNRPPVLQIPQPPYRLDSNSRDVVLTA